MTLTHALAATTLVALTALASGCNRQDTPTGAPGDGSAPAQNTMPGTAPTSPAAGTANPAAGGDTPPAGSTAGGTSTQSGMSGMPAESSTNNGGPGTATSGTNSSQGTAGDGVPVTPPAVAPASAASAASR